MILIKSYRQNLSLLFNQTCLNERLQLNYRYIYMSRAFANCPGNQHLIPGLVIPKTQMVLDAAFANTQYYKIRIKGKVEQTRE